MKKTLVPVILGLSLAATTAFAGSLTGTYVLRAPCELTYNFDREATVFIPAGKVVVSENIPMHSDTIPEHPAIIFQSGDEVAAILALGVGTVTEFAFGPEPFSVGTYSRNGEVFLEQYSAVAANGGTEFQDTIRLEKTTSGLVLTSLDRSVSPNAQPVVCSFVSAP